MTAPNFEELDPISDAALADPHSVFAEMRRRCPVHESVHFDRPLVTLADSADVHRVLAAPVLFSTTKGPGIPYDDPLHGDFQRDDPPKHTRWRKYVRPEFLPSVAFGWRGRINEIASSLIDDVIEDRSMDFASAFAQPLSLTFVVEWLGLPLDDVQQTKEWSEKIAQSLADPGMGPIAEVESFFEAVVQERRDQADAAGVGEEAVGTVVPAGVLSAYALRPFEGERLPMEEVCGLLLSLLVAGQETTSSMLTNMIWRLLERHECWDQLVAQPELAPIAVEESLRFDPPVLGLCRTNIEPVEFGGKEFPIDTKFMVLYASANRDPELFEDPETFRLDRDLAKLRTHYSFGWGAHLCLGAAFARETGVISLRLLLERLPTLRLGGPTERILPEVLWGRSKLPVAW